MTVVNPSQSSPGDTIEAADVNTPVNQIAAVVNGNLDDNNIASVSGTKISAGTVPASAMNTAANPETRFDEALPDFVASGCVWSISSGLNGDMTSGVVYVDGKRAPVSAVTARAFTASKDTYVSVTNAGTVEYSEVANGAAAPSLPANSIWLAKVVTSGAAITSVVTSGLADSGNAIYPTSIHSPSQSWTPTWTNLTVGNGTVVANYKKVGTEITGEVSIILGSTSSISGNVRFNLPITAATRYGSIKFAPIGPAMYADEGSDTYGGFVVVDRSTSVASLVCFTANLTYSDTNSVNATAPFTWTPANGDAISVTFRYEGA